ncbi:MAG: peptidoglycan-binding protein [Erysipelotrichaceae bacterium]|nr:peptidoglycan-binding protein [Erysipelotrichaceae bacterium]
MSVSDEIFSACMQAGFTKEAACALLANLQAESALKPNNLEDTKNRSLGMSDEEYTAAVDNGSYRNFVNDAGGYGLAQWTYWSRKQNLLAFAKGQMKSIGDLGMQMDFLFKEMREDYPAIYSAMKTSHDLEYLVHELLWKWENPAEKENNMKTRMAYAQGWYQKYSGWSGTSGQNTKESSGMTVEQAKEKVLNLARAEIGYHEQGDNWTKYAQDLDRTNWYNGPKNGFAWCDVFVDWLFWKSFGDPLGREMICQPTGSAGAGCLYSAQYYKNAGRWFQIPDVGDQIFFTYSPGEYSHTGIVESVQNGIVTTIEGNTSDQVARRQYTNGSSNIAGYGRPRWELASGQSSGGGTPGGSGSSSADYGRILKMGMRGDDVKKLQEDLQKLGYDLGRWGADGDFGNDTLNAIRKFQSERGLEADGEAGPITFAALKEALNKAGGQAKPKEPETPAAQNQNGNQQPANADHALKVGVNEIRNGDKGSQVKLAQACLSCLGYSVSIDGIFGNELEKKIREFQKADGLDADGVVGEKTWAKLLEIPFRG